MTQADEERSEGWLGSLKKKPLIAAIIVFAGAATGLLTWTDKTLDALQKLKVAVGYGDTVYNSKILHAYMLGREIADIEFVQTVKKGEGYRADGELDRDYASAMLQASDLSRSIGLSVKLDEIQFDLPKGFDMTSTKNFELEFAPGAGIIARLVYTNAGKDAALAFGVGFSQRTYWSLARTGRLPQSRYGFGLEPEISADLDSGRGIGFPSFELPSVDPNDVKSTLDDFNDRVFERFGG